MKTAQLFAVGDTVCWRSGKSKSKNCLPIGIANCKIVEFGKTPDGQKAARIELPWVRIKGSVLANAMIECGIPEGGTTWALVADLDNAE